jgi:hypothetical protein
VLFDKSGHDLPDKGKEIIWQAGDDWPSERFPGVIVRITADDGGGVLILTEMVDVVSTFYWFH